MKPISKNDQRNNIEKLITELNGLPSPIYPNDPYKQIDNWISKAKPVIKIFWPDIYDQFLEIINHTEWTNIAFSNLRGNIQNSPEHFEAWTDDCKDYSEYRQRIINFLEGLLSTISEPKNMVNSIGLASSLSSQNTDVKTFIEYKKKQKEIYIQKLYKNKCFELTPGNIFEFGEELGLDEAIRNEIEDELASNGSIKLGYGTVHLTSQGKQEVENVLFSKEPNKTEQIVSYVFNIGDNATINGAVFAQQILESFNQIKTSDIQPELKEELEELNSTVSELIKSMPAEIAKEVMDNLQTITQEVTSPSPNKQKYELSFQKLIQAAKNLKELGEPILKLSASIISLLWMKPS